jgi:predicted SnoaL-like aldol condensation-catalyzing enzyme
MSMPIFSPTYLKNDYSPVVHASETLQQSYAHLLLEKAKLVHQKTEIPMNKKLENATNLYMHGIRDGRAIEAVTEFTGDRYTQHSAGVKSGKEGFIEFFKPFLERNPVRDIKIIRSITDGQYVFVHVFQSLNNGESKWVTMDMFDMDANDRIIEHWDVICADQETPSGLGMTGGATEVEDRKLTVENKSLVTSFLKHVFVEGDTDFISRLVSESCIQHSSEIHPGIAGWHDYFDSGLRYEFVHQVIGEGNFVVALSKSFRGSTNYAVFNLFRIENSKIAEHWDCIEEIAPKEQWATSGKF